MKNIVFFVRHFTERGTEVSVYNYAHYNETLLGNKSYIVYFSDKTQEKYGQTTVKHSFKKFADRFPMIQINQIEDMAGVIKQYNIDFFYTQCQGMYGDYYQFQNRNIWVPPCKTIKHCVFYTCGPEADYYISIGNDLNIMSKTNCLVIPYIVTLPRDVKGNMRAELGIPDDAIVFGRHGGTDEFSIDYVKDLIHEIIDKYPNYYFVFMNTNKFGEDHPRIIHIGMVMDEREKVRFINTCDAMLHARNMGETFGMAVAEFSYCNKPVITCSNAGTQEHTMILGDRAIKYDSKESLRIIFEYARDILSWRRDWNAYEKYTPENVMGVFRDYIFG